MMKSDRPREAHLVLRKISVPAGGEWAVSLTGWTVFQVRQGTGYYLEHQSNQELEPGAVLLIPDGAKGSLRASQLGDLSIIAFSVMPARLTGLITLHEQKSLELAAARKTISCPILSPTSPVAAKMEGLNVCKHQDGLSFRLKLLEIFVETVGIELGQTVASEEVNASASDARKRLEALLKQTPTSELLEMNFNELAQMTHCTTRHLSRVFQELVGMSFRDKRAELRLARARELLATSNSKVVDVALESGYKSLSLFNLMFARRYGTSPGKWRQKHGSPKNMIPAYFQRGRGYKN
jgi:AraC-like DNA-binding protein